MPSACPQSQTPQDFGCGVQRCCDSTSCDVNISGPCICATYGDASPSQNGWNYSFIAQCAPNRVSTLDGTACRTLLGVEYVYSCYCRPRVSGDVGSEGDRMDGNAIFDMNEECTVFKAGAGATPTTPSAVPTPSGGGAGRRYGKAAGIGTRLLVLLLVAQIWWA